MLSQPLRASHFLNVEILHTYILSPSCGSALIKFFCGWGKGLNSWFHYMSSPAPMPWALDLHLNLVMKDL